MGTIIPLKNEIVSDLGLKVTSSGIFIFIFGFILKLLSKQIYYDFPLTVIINTSLIVLFSGILIDDMQHIKYKLEFEEEEEDDSSNVLLNPVRKTIPIFIESALIFGRMASLLETFLETMEPTV